MTVLVLSLSIPVIAPGASNAQIAFDIGMLVTNILAYVLGFLLLAVLWISHHNIFHYVTRMDRPAPLAEHSLPAHHRFLPFPTALMGKYNLLQLPVLIFEVNIIATSLCMLGILSYSNRSDSWWFQTGREGYG